MLSWFRIALLAGVIGAIAFAFIQGRQIGANNERAKNFKAFQAQIDERNKTNEEINSLDDAALCSALGGVFTNGQCQ